MRLNIVNILVVDDQPAKLLSYEGHPRQDRRRFDQKRRRPAKHSMSAEERRRLDPHRVCMPDIDGFELAALIREHPRFQRIAIIFVSAINDGRFTSIRGYELGALDYVSVPVVPELLQAKVKVFLGPVSQDLENWSG